MERCLKSIQAQTVAGLLEIIVLDSGSVDNSRAIAEQSGANVIAVLPADFNHGLTRNLGAKAASADLLFFTVQDAWLRDNDLLEKMSAHFTDTEVMGVVGHQAVPHEMDKNPVLWFKPYSLPEITIRQFNNPEKLLALCVDDKKDIIAWDNVISMYRHKAIEINQFAAVQMSEDWIWSYTALQKGWKLIYDPSLIVYHYHHRSFAYSFKLVFSINYHFLEYFGFKPTILPVFLKNTKIIYHLVKNRELSWKQKLYWIKYNIGVELGDYFSRLYFRILLFVFGRKAIEKRYNKICNIIPQGIQNSKHE